MALRAVILVPSQGKHVQQFYWSARGLKDKVYMGRAEIVKVELGPAQAGIDPLRDYDDREIRFSTEKDQPFSFGNHRNLRSVVTISHAAPKDGPNLLYGEGGNQPWGIYGRRATADNVYSGGGKFHVDMLRPRARDFWRGVGRSLAVDGKIIMLGCNLGLSFYLNHVANASDRKAYGPTSACSAADVNTVVGLVKKIEIGTIPAPMKEVRPGTFF